MAEEFKCEECGRKFKQKEGLRKHTNEKHPKKKMKVTSPFKSRLKLKLSKKKLILISFISIFLFSGSLIYVFGGNYFSLALVGQPVSQDFYFNMTSVNDSVLNSIGAGTSEKLATLEEPPLTADGKPLVLYVGAEYCPYCASERWSIILALSKFGNFTGLKYMLSSPTDVFANTPTFTFVDANYTSPYVSFQSVELLDRYYRPLQNMTPDQASNFNTYNIRESFPFVNIGNQYLLIGAQYSPFTLSGLGWNQTSEKMNDPTSAVAKGVDGSANILVSAICKITNQTPSSVCNQTYAKLSPT